MSHLCHNQNRLQKNVFMENLSCHFLFALACKCPLDHWSQEWTTKCIKSENSNNIGTKTYQTWKYIVTKHIATTMVRTLCMVIEFIEKRGITKNKGIEACILVNHAYNNKNIQDDIHGTSPMESWFWISFFFSISTKQRHSLDT